ncbi:GNAT family N-acetyltransferase [Planktotalea arctica]|uniref:GNAT family N-acetyltransferase n=1 Tax=Planktotalea arctica TaxID=1481893 RepID=UPI003219DC0E
MKKYKKASSLSAHIDVPSNTPLGPMRARSAGILSSGEISQYRAEGIALAFDPMQQGWVSDACEDDLSMVLLNQLDPTARRKDAQSGYALRAWSTGDVDSYIALLGDPDVWRFMPENYPAPFTRDLATALIELSNASNHHQVFAVEFDGDPVGQVRLEFDVEPENPACAEISYWLGRVHWGKGIGSDVVKLFTARCLRDNLGLTSLIARAHRENIGSLRALKKAGYVLEGADPKHADWLKMRLIRD